MLRYITLLYFLCVSGCASGNTSIVYTDYGAAGYKESSNSQYQKLLRKVGAQAADLLYTCYTKNERSSTVDCQSYDSPKTESFFNLTKELKRKGLRVTVRFYIDLKNKKWRAFWNPLKPKEAFKSIRDNLLPFAKEAQKQGVDNLLIGSEMELLSKANFQGEWRKLIQSLRNVFKGKLLYAANGNINQEKIREFRWVPFWSNLDGIGINYYPPFNLKANEETLRQHHKKSLSKLIQFAKEIGKPLYLTEVGFPLAKRGINTPYEWRYKAKEVGDKKLRNLSLKIFLSEAKKVEIEGIHLWRFFPGEEKVHPLGYVLDDSFLSVLKNQK